MAFIGTLILILVATTIAGHFSARVGIPAVIGELLIGIIIGPGVLNWVHNSSALSVFANIGVILLMFMAGLESNLAQLKKVLRPALAVAVCGVILPVVLMGGVSLAFGYHFTEALFIGVVFSATSVSISVVVLREFHALDTRAGATILGAAVADDIIGVLLLSLMVALIGGGAGEHGNTNMGLQFLFQVGFFVAAYLLVKWIAPMLMRISERLLIPTARTVTAVVICLGMAYLAEVVGLSGAIGAFFAGIAVAQTHVKQVIDDHIEPISNAFFVPVFFVSIGLNVTFAHFITSLPFIVLMTILAVVTKWWGGEIGARLTGFSKSGSRVVGTGMVARGEMALITAQIGFDAHLLANGLYVDMIFVIVFSTLAAPLLLRWALSKDDSTAVSTSDK
ncbi:cation:proton antiporter [Furfurilactobacillus milii]|uniref:Sodium:proton antiporter n=1 Tax=Furfurilactobacillus milii TaxID=2888272 RepID=A0A6N9I3N9_9LACO|nr:cation:proton antiporter [Furfurilactobacillus milii]MYV17334.1 sodium:proton antiporter [Furfurilactobacillus milii]